RSLSQARGENVTAAGSRRQRCRDSDREGSAAVWVCRAARKLGSRGLLCFAGKGMGLFMDRLRWGLGLFFFGGIVNWIVRYGCVFRGLFFFVGFLSFFVVQEFALGTEPISVVVLLRAAKADRLFAAFAAAHAVVAKVALAGFAEVETVARGGVSAVAAGPAVPVIQTDIGTAAVVGVQDTADELEGITDAALGQGIGDRQRGIAGAE